MARCCLIGVAPLDPYGAYCTLKKPAPLVMNKYCVLTEFVEANNPPLQFAQAAFKAGLNCT